MNDHEKNSEMESWIDPELEARVVAWVAGEASPFEIAELERLCAEKPELAVFKRRIAAVQGLVAEAVRPDAQPLVMSAERRAKLLATLGGAAPEKSPVIVLSAERQRLWRRQGWLVGTAAVAAMLALAFVWLGPKKAYRQGEMPRAMPTLVQTQGVVSADQEKAKARRVAQVDNDIRTAMSLKDLSAPAALAGSRGGAAGIVAGNNTFSYRDGALSNLTVSGGGSLSLNGGIIGASSADKTNASALQSRMAAEVVAGSGATFSTTSSEVVKLDAFEVANPPKTSFGGFSAGYGGSGGRKKETILATGAATIGSAASAPSPFEVKPADQYTANGTLAGTRLRSELKDQAASLSVVTKNFMEDVKPQVDQKAATPAAPAATDADDAVRRAPAPPAEPSIEETSTATEPVSTFSLHVSDVSFRLAQAALARGAMPDPTQMRPEEIYNAFDYGDPSPATAEKVGARIEQAAHPFLQQRNLVRIALKVAATGRAPTQPLRLTVLLDTSGSMEREDRAATVRRAMAVLVSLLGERDHITLIGFARQPRLLAENLPGAQARGLLDLIARTPAEGGTNLEEALKLAGELARRHQAAGEQNRIVVLTDGAANLGDADPARLAAMIESLRQQRIAFDACGVGLEGLDDAMLESLTRKGDGRYYVLNSPEAADAGFARQLAGAFRPAAENVKVQVRFNPARVANYRLIGFEQHRLRTEDFRNDQVDAAELAAEEAAVALYQVEPRPQGEGELGEVFVRFRDPASGQMVERSWTMLYEPRAAAFDRATPAMQLAGAAALVAEKLRESPLARQFKLGDFAGVVNGLRTRYPDQARVQEFVTMFGQLRRISGE